MENRIVLTPSALGIIKALQDPDGPYQTYRACLDRLFNYILNDSDEIGMGYREAMSTLRTLNSIRRVLSDIAGSPTVLDDDDDDPSKDPDDEEDDIDRILDEFRQKNEEKD